MTSGDEAQARKQDLIRRRLPFRSLAVAVFTIPLVTCSTPRCAADEPAPRANSGAERAQPEDETSQRGNSATSPASSAPSPDNAVDQYLDPLPQGAIARLGTVRYRHSGWYKRMAFLPDGETFLVGTGDNTLRAWNAATGKLVHELDLAGYRLQAFCLAPSGELLATLSHKRNANEREYDFRLTVWDPETWSEEHRHEWTEPLGEGPQHMAMSPFNDVIGLGAADGTVRIHAVTGVELFRKKVVEGEIESLDFSPAGDLLAVASRRGVALLKFLTEEEPQTLSRLPRGGQVVRFSQDGTLLIVGEVDDHAAKIFDVESRELVRQLKGKSTNYYREGLCVSADGTQLIVPANAAKSCEVFDIETGQLVRSYDAGVAEPRDAALSADGRFLVSVGSHAAIVVWDARTGERISDRFVGHSEASYDLAFTPDGRQIITGCLDGTIRIWNAATGAHERMLKHDRWVAAIALSPDGKWLLSSGLDDTVRLWNLGDGSERFELPGHGNTGGSMHFEVAFSPDGKRFFSFGSDMYLRTYNTANGRILAEHAIRPGGAAAEETEDGLPVKDREDVFGFGGGPFSMAHARFMPDGTALVLGEPRPSAIHFFNLESGKSGDVIRIEQALDEYAISPDSAYVAIVGRLQANVAEARAMAAQKCSLRLYDRTSKQSIRDVELPGSSARRLTFSSDGKRIGVATSEYHGDGNSTQHVLVLDVESFRPIAQIENAPESTHSMAFSPDGTKLATSHQDTTVMVWDLAK
ncbi:MAG TPA: WD40 repeat domain-containing protein, partial [Lacipirellulaceae bacterium]|nr:WD40 repeat domain-containing protein [Lacipirellulaceae bacterium]